MESCLTDMGKTYVEKLINGTVAELRHVFCFTSIANEFKEKKTWLEEEIKTLEQHATVAAGNDKDVEAKVLKWKEKAQKLVQEDIQTKQTCFFGVCPDCIWRYKKGKELANNIEEIKQLTEKAENFGNIEVHRRLPDIERYSSKDYISFPTRVSKYKELLDALKDDNNYITGLQGMGGTGKTTLAKELGKELKKSEQFAYVIDTTVSFTPDTKQIQDDIAGSLGLEWEDCNDSDRPKKLWSRLTNGDKILLIMDDVWDQDPPLDFDLIGIPKQDNHRGCRILITTRSKQILSIMGCEKIIELDLLHEEEAWAMFKMYAGPFTKSLISTGREIAKECKQLPVAIAVIASSLKGQQDRKHKWDATLKSLKKTVFMDDVDKEKVGIYKCLKSSYDRMEDEKAKGLFLLSCLFPEDNAIPIEILTRLGIGTGLFGKSYGSYNDARNQVAVAKDILIDSCLLVKVGEEHVKMHDLVREAAQWIACKEIRHVNLWNKDEKSSVEKEKEMKYLYCEGKDMDLFSWKYDGSKLETLILDVETDEDRKCMEATNYLFENIDQLQVLYFSSHGELPLSLPHSIHSLSNIRSILVDRVDLGDISVLGNLQTLETLDLVECIINEFPDEIAKLGKFKLLNLQYCEIRRNDPFEVIKKCSILEELYFTDSFNDFCQEITLPQLQRYRISKSLTMHPDSLSKYVSFVASDDDECFFSKDTFKYFMQTTEGLQLEEIKVEWRNLMPEIVPIDRGMKDLVVLRLKCISQLQCLIDTNASQFPNLLPNLVVLDLDLMKNLEELFNGSLSFDSLKCLEKVSIKRCEMLRKLFNFNLNLCNLKTLTLWDCPLLVSLFPVLTCGNLVLLEELRIKYCTGLENIVIGDKSDGPMLQKLRVLCIVRCDRLELIFPFLSIQDLPVLEVIDISHCEKLKYVFGKYQNVEHSSLKDIVLHSLTNFMAIFPENSFMNKSSSTSRDGFKTQLQVDPVKCNLLSWSGICCHKDPLHSNSSKSVSSSHDRLQIWEHAQCFQVRLLNLCNVKYITLHGILKIKSVFILSITPIMMLETLNIKYCDDLNNIILDIGGKYWGDVFPKLKKLKVHHCKKLEYIFGHHTDEHQNNTKIHLHLPTLECLDLYNLSSLIALCVKQYRTTFPPLKKLKFLCSNVAIKSIGEFIVSHSASDSLDNTNKEELSGSMGHFIALESLVVRKSKAENILNGIEGQEMKLGLQKIELHDLNDMMGLFVGPKNSFALENLKFITIERCEILEIVFSNSISTSLSQLTYLKIENCKELKHIIEDDDTSRTFFSKLETLFVINCPKLKCVFPVSICKQLPKLEELVIRGADELEEIFKFNGDDNVEIPNLNVLVFHNLPSLFDAQGIHFQLVENRLVRNCQKLLSLTSTSFSYLRYRHRHISATLRRYLNNFFNQINNEIIAWRQVEATLRDEFSLQKLGTQQSTTQQGSINQPDPLEEIDTTIKSSQCVKETNDQSIQEDYMSDKIVAATISEITNEIVAAATISPKLKGVEKAKTITASTHLELVSSSQEQDVDVRHYLETTKVNDNQDLHNRKHFESRSQPLEDETRGYDTGNENPSAETTKNTALGVEIEVEAALGQKLTSSQIIMKQTPQADHELAENASNLEIPSVASSKELEKNQPLSEQRLIKQQDPRGEIDTTIKPSQGDQEETALTEDLTIRASSHSELASSSQVNEQDVDVSDSLETTMINDNRVSLNEDVVMKETPIIEEQFSKPSPSNSVPMPLAFQAPSMHFEGNPSQKVEDLSSPYLVTRKLEEMVSKKYLDYENLSLLTDFLVKHPSVLLSDKYSNGYKGQAYKFLTKLLKFLQTHSVLDVLGSCHSEFVELLHDVRSFSFDKEWLDGVEKGALFPDLQFSQDALQKLLVSKKQITEDVEVLRFKIDILTQNMEDLKQQLSISEANLESVIQQEKEVVESKAALSVPLGY